jgi:hypothetical protein
MLSELLIHFTKGMNIIWHLFPFQYFATQSLGNWKEGFFWTLFEATHHNLATALRKKARGYRQRQRR